MKITKKKLQKIIKEEAGAVLKEATLASLGKELANQFGGYFTGGFGKSGSTQRNTTEFGSDNYVWFDEDSDRDIAWEQISAAANSLGKINGMEAIEHNGAILLKTYFKAFAGSPPAIALVSKRKKWPRDANADRY
jgi:hypothetical protein